MTSRGLALSLPFKCTQCLGAVMLRELCVRASDAPLPLNVFTTEEAWEAVRLTPGHQEPGGQWPHPSEAQLTEEVLGEVVEWHHAPPSIEAEWMPWEAEAGVLVSEVGCGSDDTLSLSPIGLKCVIGGPPLSHTPSLGATLGCPGKQGDSMAAGGERVGSAPSAMPEASLHPLSPDAAPWVSRLSPRAAPFRGRSWALLVDDINLGGASCPPGRVEPGRRPSLTRPVDVEASTESSGSEVCEGAVGPRVQESGKVCHPQW